MRRLREVLRGLLSLLLLVVLLAGIPAALIALRGNPMPDVAVNTGAVLDALTRPDDGSLFLAALTWVGWASWASFAVSVLLEIPAQVRGLPSPHLAGLGLQQNTASVLLAGVALLLVNLPVTAGPGAATQPRPVAVAAATAPAASILAGTALPTLSATDRTAPTDAPVHSVLAGDTLWQIAQDRLGDGARYTEIAALNYCRAQPDGQALTSDHWLRAGWTLVLPADASVKRSDAVTGRHIVRAGETLHQIAHDELGPATDERELFAANRGRVQGDGGRLTDPDLIRTGWVLDVPSLAEADLPAATGPAPDLTGPTPPPDVASPAVDPPAAQAPVVQVPVVQVPARPQTDAAPEAGAQQPEQDQAADDLMSPAVRTASGVGGLLACSLLVLLAARRWRQQRRRQPGQRIELPPPELEAAECQLRAVADPQSRLRIDQSLRTLSVLLGQTGQHLPGLHLVRLQQQHLELVLAQGYVLPAPFTATQDPAVWRLDSKAPLLSATDLADVAAPYPALVTIGHDIAGGHVLLEMEQVGALSVDGDQPAALAVLAAVAAELATSDFADDLQVTLVGGLPELADALGTGRVRYVPTLRAVLPELERRVADVRTVLRTDGLADLQQARTATPGEHLHGDCWTPEIVLIAGPVDPTSRDRLSALLHDQPCGGVAAVMIGGGGIWRLGLDGTDAGPDAVAVLSPCGVRLRPQLLTGPDLTELLALLAVAARPPATPAGQVADPVLPELTLPDLGRQLTAPQIGELAPDGDQDGPADNPARAIRGDASLPTRDSPDTLLDGVDGKQGAPPLVLVLGPVEVQGARGTLEEGKRRQLTEIAAFLALRPGADHHGFSEAIWPGARAVETTRNTAFSKLRTWLGPEFVPRVSSNGYRLDPAVRTDWHQWQELLAAGTATSTADLAAALDLVRGQPFEGHDPRRYTWSERGKQEMISAIGDAAHELAGRALLAGDATLARRAAAAGLQVDPGAETLWRDALRAEWLAGDRAGLEGTARRLTALVDDLDDELEPETVALLGQLLRQWPLVPHRGRREVPPDSLS